MKNYVEWNPKSVKYSVALFRRPGIANRDVDHRFVCCKTKKNLQQQRDRQDNAQNHHHHLTQNTHYIHSFKKTRNDRANYTIVYTLCEWVYIYVRVCEYLCDYVCVV